MKKQKKQHANYDQMKSAMASNGRRRFQLGSRSHIVKTNYFNLKLHHGDFSMFA